MAEEQPPERNVTIQSTVNVGTATDQTSVRGAQVSVQSAREVHVHSAPAAPLQPALHQLRAPIGFVGREQEIDQLVRALTKTSGTAAISGVRGMGGIGKTELAYKVAHKLRIAFPDAQLLIELRGASKDPLPSAQALQTIIRAFEREARLPDDVAQLRGIYCSVLDGKRALILADDAKDAAQVRPLLPPAGCALLVTSRNRFSLPGMRSEDSIDLGVLPPEEAKELLREICPRIGKHAGGLAKLCGYLPLALRVSAGVLEANDSRGVPHYLKQLEAERLKHLNDPDDPTASVEASLQLSYDALEPAAQTALCQLSVFPTSFEPAAATAVVVVEGDVTGVLEVLRRRSLLEWDARLERSSLHELVRVFAAARLEDADTVRLRHAEYYAKVAAHAHYDLYRKGDALAGLALFDKERPQIDAGWNWARERAGNPEADALLLEYPNALASMAILRYDMRRERVPQLETQLAAAQRLGQRNHEGYALGNLGIAYKNLGNTQQAIDCFEQHLVIARELGDRRSEGSALGNLGIVYKDLGDTQKAIDFYERVLVIARELGDRRSEGNAFGNLGIAYAILGDTQKAIDYFEQQLVIARELGDRRQEGVALGNLGIVYKNLGGTQKVIDFYEQALAIARELGDRAGEARHCWNLGLVLAQQGDLARAVELIQVCVDIRREIGHPDAEGAAAYLDQLRQRLAAPQNSPPADAPDEA